MLKLNESMYNTTKDNATLYENQVSVSCAPGYHLDIIQKRNLNRVLKNNDVTENITCTATGEWSKPSGCVSKGDYIDSCIINCVMR